MKSRHNTQRRQGATYQKILSDAQKWEETVHKYKAAADAKLAVHEERVRKGHVICLDEPGEIFRIYQVRRSAELERDAAAQALRNVGLIVSQNGVSWDEEDPRFQDEAFAPKLYGLIRRHQQTLEGIALLNLTVRRAEEWGISRRYALISMPGILRDFQLSVVPVLEYNLLRMLKLDGVAMAMLTGLNSATTSLQRSPRLKGALAKKRQEDGGGDLRAKLREEFLSAIAELPHVGNQLDTTPAGFKRFFDFKNKVTRELTRPPGTSAREHLAADILQAHDGGDLTDQTAGDGGPLETLLAVESAQEYQDRFARFSQLLSPQEKEMVEVIRQLEEEQGAGNFQDKDIAARLGIPTHNIPNMRKRMAGKLKRVA